MHEDMPNAEGSLRRQAARLKEKISATASNPALSPLAAPTGGSPLMGGSPFLTPRSSMTPSTSVLTPRASLSSPRSFMGTPRTLLSSPRGPSMTPRGRPAPGVSPLSRLASGKQYEEPAEHAGPGGRTPYSPVGPSASPQGDASFTHQGNMRLQSRPRAEAAQDGYRPPSFASPVQQQKPGMALALHADARAFTGPGGHEALPPAQRSPVPLLPLDRLKQMQL